MVLVYAALAFLLAVPVLVGQTPLGGDDMNHLARICVRAHIGSDPDLARIFKVKSDLIPYLGMDLLLTPLARVLPIMVVGRLYILAMVWGLVGAIMVLRRVFTGRIGLAPAAAGLIAYNGVLAWGLLNYALGLILALLAFAAWHSQRERPWLVRLILFTGAASAIYLTHLLAFVLYGVLVVSYELFGRRQPWRTPLRDWALLIMQALPGFVLWITVSEKINFTPAFIIDYGAIRQLLYSKGVILQSPFMFRGASGGVIGDLETGLFSGALCIAGIYVGIREAWLTAPRTLTGPALTLLAFTLALPEQAFGIALIGARFPVAVACLVLAGLKPTPAAPLRLAVPVSAAIALLTVAHLVDVALLMHSCDARYSEVRRAVATLPRGVTLSTVFESEEPTPLGACTNLSIYLQMAQLVTIDRSGYESGFYSRVTSVGVRSGYVIEVGPTPADKFTTAPRSGYVLWMHFGHRRPVPPHLVLLWRGSFFDLWAVAPQAPNPS